MRVWCALSGHGFGHLVQTASVLNRLSQSFPDLTLHISGRFPQDLVQRWVRHPFTLDSSPQDIGLIQNDPLDVDLRATHAAYRQFHDHWVPLERDYRAALTHWKPDLVLGNIPYLPLSAAASLRIPTVAMSSLSWDLVLMNYFSLSDPQVRDWWEQIRASYARVDLAIQVTPGQLGDGFQKTVECPPLVEPVPPCRKELRSRLNVHGDQPIVLLSMGGIPLEGVSWPELEKESRACWLVPGQGRLGKTVIGFDGISDWPFQRIAASVDALVGKLGYNTAVQAVASGVPLLYTRRIGFPDEPQLAAWLQKYHPAREISRAMYDSGVWFPELEALWAMPWPKPPRLGGAEKVVEHIVELLH